MAGSVEIHMLTVIVYAPHVVSAIADVSESDDHDVDYEGRGRVARANTAFCEHAESASAALATHRCAERDRLLRRHVRAERVSASDAAGSSVTATHTHSANSTDDDDGAGGGDDDDVSGDDDDKHDEDDDATAAAAVGDPAGAAEEH